MLAGVVAGLPLGAFVASDQNPAWLSAAAGLITAGTAITAGFVGIRTYRGGRADSKAASRPMVVAELQRVPYSHGFQRLVLRNDGPSIARHIRVHFDPELPDTSEDPRSIARFLRRRYAREIAVLTPRMELENLYFVMTAKPGVNAEPLPNQVTVKVAYSADDGTPYEDVFPLDTDLLRDDSYTVSSSSPDEQQKKHVEAAEATAKEMKNINKTLGEAVRGGSNEQPDNRDDLSWGMFPDGS